MALSVPERGSVRVSRADWQILAADPSLWALVSNKILSIEHRGIDQVHFRGSCYVGRTVVGGITIEFAEKFPGAFQALCRAALPSNIKLVKAPTHVGDSPFTTALLVKLFIDAISRYVAGSRQISYISKLERGSLIGGKLDAASTIRLRARGIRHQVAFRRTTMTSVTNLNLILCAALLRIEALFRSGLVGRDSAILARSMTIIFADCQGSVIRLSSEALRDLAVRQSDEASGEFESYLSELAAAILGEAGFGEEGLTGSLVRQSWFVNLENLFERAIRSQLAEVLEGKASVTAAIRPPSVFPDVIGRYPANTDVVIRTAQGVCIGDAKYKERRPYEWPDSGEVQELLTHAAAYQARMAFLAFPADSSWSMRVGTDRNGCEVWCFGIRLENFSGDMAEVVNTLGLARTTEGLTQASA